MNHAQEQLIKRIRAQDKTIRILSERLEKQVADNVSGFALFEQNVALEKVVSDRTEELEQQRLSLENALMELKATQAELLQAQKLQSIGQLAAGIAHEINTPAHYVTSNLDFIAESFEELMRLLDSYEDAVNSANGYADAYERVREQLGKELDKADMAFIKEEMPDALDSSKEGIRRIAKIVKAMKSFAHQGGDIFQYFDLESLILSTAEICRNEWSVVADLKTDIDPELKQIEGARDELGQVLLNLIVNAAHAIEEHPPKHGQKGRIEVSTQRLDGYAQIRVSDNGGGIPPEIQGKVFDPFYTTKDVGKGSGQGLAICYNIVHKRHQGKLFFETKEGYGTDFIIQIPV